MISVHWIPTHRGAEDKERFDLWQPPYVKIVCIDERPPYSEDVPLDSKIVVRNHPMSENYGNRMLNAMTAESSWPTSRLYEEYFAYTHDSRYADQRRAKVQQRPGFTAWVASADSPELTGIMHAETCQRMAVYLLGKGVAQNRMVFEGLNEPQLWANEPPDLVARYYKAFLGRLHDYGLHGVVGNFGVGWPGNGGVQDALVDWDFFKPVIGIMQPGDYLGLHEYWALNGPQENWRWWAGRFLQCPFDVTILVTECGIDTGVTGNWYGGWYDLPGTMDEKAVRYVDEIYWYARQCAADGRVQGIFPFTWDIGGKEWEKFDIRNQQWWDTFFHVMKEQGLPQPGNPVPEPEPEPTPEPVPVSGYEIKAAVVYSAHNEGVSYILGRNFMVDAAGNEVKPMQKEVEVRWHTEEDPANWIYPEVAADGTWSFTPAQITGYWLVRAVDPVRQIDSGWHYIELDHQEMKMEFRWTPIQYASLPEALHDEAEKNDLLAVNPNAALCKAGAARGLWPTSNEFDLNYEGVAYRAQRFRNPKNDVITVLFCVVGDWANIASMDY